jgi:hypothetical protein
VNEIIEFPVLIYNIAEKKGGSSISQLCQARLPPYLDAQA